MKWYTVVHTTKIESLEREVEGLLKDGWELHGNLEVVLSPGVGLFFYQPMVMA